MHAGGTATSPLPPDTQLVSLVAESIPSQAVSHGLASHEELGRRWAWGGFARSRFALGGFAWVASHKELGGRWAWEQF